MPDGVQSSRSAGRSLPLEQLFLLTGLPAVPCLIGEFFPCALNGESLPVQQAADLQYELHVPAAVEPVARGTLARPQHRELRFPVTQYIRLRVSEPADLANPEVEFFRDESGLKSRLIATLRTGCAALRHRLLTPSPLAFSGHFSLEETLSGRKPG